MKHRFNKIRFNKTVLNKAVNLASISALALASITSPLFSQPNPKPKPNNKEIIDEFSRYKYEITAPDDNIRFDLLQVSKRAVETDMVRVYYENNNGLPELVIDFGMHIDDNNHLVRNDIEFPLLMKIPSIYADDLSNVKVILSIKDKDDREIFRQTQQYSDSTRDILINAAELSNGQYRIYDIIEIHGNYSLLFPASVLHEWDIIDEDSENDSITIKRLIGYITIGEFNKVSDICPRMLASVPNLRETSVKATPVSEVNIGGTFAPGYAGYIDLNRISNDLPNVFHDDGSVDGGLLYDIYNSQGYISDFIKPGHDEWQNRQTWVNNVRTIDDFLRYVFGVVDVNYNPNTGEYSLVQDESEAIVRNDGDSYNGILRRGISYQFKLGEGETIRFVRGTTLDLFSGIVVGFDDKDRLRRALASGKFSLYKLTVDANIVPVDLSWHEEPGLERASNISVLNVNGNMVIQGQEDIPLEESSERGFMGTVGLGMGATFKGFILDAYSSAAVGVVGTRISMPGVRAKARLIGPQLLVLPIGISPSAVVSYDFTTKEWVVEGGVYASVKSAIVSGEAGIGPMKLVAGGYREADKTVRIGVFVPLAKWLDIQGKIGIGGKHLSPDELEQRWGGMLKLKPTSWGDLTVSAQYDPFNKKIVYGIQVGVDVIKLFKLK